MAPLSWLPPWPARRAPAGHLYRLWAQQAPPESPAAWRRWWRKDAKDGERLGRIAWRAGTTLRTRTCLPSTSARTKGPRRRAAGEKKRGRRREREREWRNNGRELGEVTLEIMAPVMGYMWVAGERSSDTRDNSATEGGGGSEGGLGQRDESVIHLWNEVWKQLQWIWSLSGKT